MSWNTDQSLVRRPCQKSYPRPVASCDATFPSVELFLTQNEGLRQDEFFAYSAARVLAPPDFQPNPQQSTAEQPFPGDIYWFSTADSAPMVAPEVQNLFLAFI